MKSLLALYLSVLPTEEEGKTPHLPGRFSFDAFVDRKRFNDFPLESHRTL